MKQIKSIKKLGHLPVYDITVDEANHYITDNGVVNHNTGLIYSATQAFIIGKAQEKDGTDLLCFKFTINIEKSRHVREKAKLAFIVTYDKGILKYSGLLDLALESGHIIKPKKGWYSIVDMETGEISEKSYREKQLTTAKIWDPIMADDKFRDFVKKKFQLGAAYNATDEAEDDYNETFYDELPEDDE